MAKLKTALKKTACIAVVVSAAMLTTYSVAQTTYTPNFNGANIEDMALEVGKVLDKSVILDQRVKGTIVAFSPKPLTQQEYYEFFLQILDVNGFSAVENNDVITVIPNREIRQWPTEVLENPDVSNPGSEYVTHVVQLNNVAAQTVVPVLRPLMPTNSQPIPIAASNQLVISDTVANLNRLLEIIEKIDKAAVPGVELIELEYADAEELVRLIEQLERSNVPANQAATQLKIVADARTNSIIVSGEPLQRDRIKELIRGLDQPQPQSGNVRVIYLQYADAGQIAQVLTNVVQNMAKLNPNEANSAQRKADATIEAEEDTNALIITADIDTLNSLQAVIDRLDIQRAQVLVEAIIVEIKDEVGKNLGIQWIVRDDDGGFASSIKPGNNSQAIGQIVESALDDDNEDALIGLGSVLAGVAGQTFGVGRLGGSSDLLALVNMLQAQTGTNILSTPNLLTIDNNEASITVGESVPLVTGSFTSTGDSGSAQNPFQTIERSNIGTTLTVTPHVNEGNKVILELSQEISSISAKAGAVDLITNERKIETKVLVGDGETVVLGGLIKDNVIRIETRVPLLGSIPLLGHLFRSESTTVEKTNLLVFIRTTIIRDDETLTGATAEKYKFIRDQQLQQREINSLLVNEDILPLLPDWDEVQAERLAKLKKKRQAADAAKEYETIQQDIEVQ